MSQFPPLGTDVRIKGKRRWYAVLALLGFLGSAGSGIARQAPAQAGLAATNGVSTVSLHSAESEQQDRALRQEQMRVAEQLKSDLPQNADAVYAAGFVSNEQGDSASAIRYWEEVLRLDTAGARIFNRAEVCYNLGYLHLLKEDYEKAVPLLQESVLLNPRRQEAFYRLAHAFYLQGEAEESLRTLEQGKVETPLACRLRGQAAQQLGKLEDARKYYEAAIRLNPDFAEAYYGLATTCARLGEAAKAEEYREKFNVLKSAVQVEGRQARTDFNPLAITRGSLARTHTEVGRVYMAYGQSEKAEKLFLRAAEMDPGNTACRFQLVMLYQQAQRNAEALRFAQEMVKAEPRNPFHYLALGNLQARMQQRAQAEQAFKQVVALAPGRPEGYFALAQFYLQANTQPGEALRLANRAVALAPTAVNHYVLSQACAANGDVAGASAAIARACELDPNNANFREWRVSLDNRK